MTKEKIFQTLMVGGALIVTIGFVVFALVIVGSFAVVMYKIALLL